MSEVVFLYVTAPDAETARTIAAALIRERRAACVNILPDIRSIYEWEGALEETTETPFLVKTTAAADAGARIAALHPYETPCIVALPVAREGSHPAFLDWIAGQTAPDGAPDSNPEGGPESASDITPARGRRKSGRSAKT